MPRLQQAPDLRRQQQQVLRQVGFLVLLQQLQLRAQLAAQLLVLLLQAERLEGPRFDFQRRSLLLAAFGWAGERSTMII